MPVGTVKVRLVPLDEAILDSLVEAKYTVLPVEVNPEPVMVTLAPTGPAEGVSKDIFGVKVSEEASLTKYRAQSAPS